MRVGIAVGPPGEKRFVGPAQIRFVHGHGSGEEVADPALAVGEAQVAGIRGGRIGLQRQQRHLTGPGSHQSVLAIHVEKDDAGRGLIGEFHLLGRQQGAHAEIAEAGLLGGPGREATGACAGGRGQDARLELFHLGGAQLQRGGSHLAGTQPLPFQGISLAIQSDGGEADIRHRAVGIR